MTSVSSMIGLAAVAVVTTIALVACAATPRTTPNDAELTAVIRASGFVDSGGRLELGAPWVQLWTQAQLPGVLSQCVGRGLVVDDCYAAHPVDTRVFAMNEPQRVELYGYYLTFLDRCLASRGYHVDRIPSRAAFLSAVNDGSPWSSYDAVTVGTRAEWYALSDACPPVPSAIDNALLPR